MSVTLTVHRSAHEIGGNCIEIRAGDERLILDIGRPLNAPEAQHSLLPVSLDLSGPPAAVLISHPHQDHYGLLAELPAPWPVYCGDATRDLIQLTNRLFGATLERRFQTWRSGEASTIGAFSIRPMLTDHSAFDAHMLLIEVAGRKLLYSGDFRRHGRKAKLVQRLMQPPPRAVDLLLMEGTNLGSDKPTRSEGELEGEFLELFRETPGRVFVAWSAQNIDRTVTLYRAALRAGRTLVVDLYTAEVLRALARYAALPQPDWSRIKVVITCGLARMYRRRGEDAFVQEMAANGISARRLNDTPGKWVVMVRPSLARDYARSGVTPTQQDSWSYSQWRGYLQADEGRALQSWFAEGGASARHIHTSGHASPADLSAFARAIGPRWLVPIHGIAWDDARDDFPPILRLRDGSPTVV